MKPLPNLTTYYRYCVPGTGGRLEAKEEEEERNVDEGQVVDGVVTFDGPDEASSASFGGARKKKVYYSSSDDEDKQDKDKTKRSHKGDGARAAEIKKKVKKAGKTKEELRQKWEQEQAARREREEKAKGKKVGEARTSDGKRYYSSSDDEDKERNCSVCFTVLSGPRP